MPTEGGSKDAIAVPSKVGNQLNSAYTFMLGLIVGEIWAAILLFGLLLSVRKAKNSHNTTVINTGIWNTKDSPFSVLKLVTTYFVKLRRERRFLLLLWVFLALATLVIGYALPIEVAPLILLGNAAPVSPTAIYVPNIDNDSLPYQLQVNAIEAPSALRAAGSAQAANASTNAKISIGQPEIIGEYGEGEKIMRIGYGYSIKGVDFGLQHYGDLELQVEGSCITEYGWLNSSYDNPQGSHFVEDVYNYFGDSSIQQSVSLYDGAVPLAYFRVGDDSPTGPAGNLTWAAIISSVNRSSYTPSTDPWYRTVRNTDTAVLADGTARDAPYTVKSGRPALSCWQNDVWSYGHHNSNIANLDLKALPGLNMSIYLQDVFFQYLGEPKIVPLGTSLGASSLQSAASSLGEVFDAGASSLHADLERLVLASYIASTNFLTDTTLYPMNRGTVPNDVLGANNQTLPGVAEFVVWSTDVQALSVRSIIIIPVVTFVLFVAVSLLTNQTSWHQLQAFNATVLYSCLHEEIANRPEFEWKREGDTPYINQGDVEQGAIRPVYNRHSRTLSWRSGEGG
jgi:hypothetical protein